jgi:hypothetical protein
MGQGIRIEAGGVREVRFEQDVLHAQLGDGLARPEVLEPPRDIEMIAELFDQMTKLYPHWVANQSWLMFGFPQPNHVDS